MGTMLLDDVSVDTIGTGVCGNQTNNVVYAWGTNFGSGTVTFQCSPDSGTTWFDCKRYGSSDTASFTGNGCMQIQPLGHGALVRAILSSSTSPSRVYAKMLCY